MPVVLPKTRPAVPQPRSLAEPATRTQRAPPELTKKPSTLNIVLLSCGIAAPLMYVFTDILLALRWEGYSWHHEPPVGGHCDADIVIVVMDDLVSID